MKDLLAELPEEARGLLRRTEQPRWVAPMLATLTKRRFSDDDWIFECKFDGERTMAEPGGSRKAWGMRIWRSWATDTFRAGV